MQKPSINQPSDSSSQESLDSPLPTYGKHCYDNAAFNASICEKNQLPESRSGSFVKRSNAVSLLFGDAKKIYQQGGSPLVMGYPIHLLFMLLIEFCERFCYYGVRSVLLSYFTSELISSDNSEGTYLYHVYIILCYVTPLLGGFISDQYWGKFKTILYLSIVYMFGNFCLTATAYIKLQSPDSMSTEVCKMLSMISLGIIALGTGGIKPCLSAFCGDQFTEAESEKRAVFYNWFYFAINVGAIFSSASTPYIKEIITDGYWLSYLIPSILMLVAVGIYLGTSRCFRIIPPTGEMVPLVKALGGCSNSESMRKDALRTRKLTLLILPIVVFWGIFDLAGSVFTVQAGGLNRVLTIPFYGKFWLKTGSCETMNPIILVCFLIPLFVNFVYPVLGKCFRLSAERKLTMGMVFLLLQCYWNLDVQRRMDKDTTYVLPQGLYEGQEANATKKGNWNTFAFNFHCDSACKDKFKSSSEFKPYDDQAYFELMKYDNVEERLSKDYFKNFLPSGDSYTVGNTSPRFWSFDCGNPDTKEECKLNKNDTTEIGYADVALSTEKAIIHFKRGMFNKVIKLNNHWFIHQPKLTKFELFAGRSLVTFYGTTSDKVSSAVLKKKLICKADGGDTDPNDNKDWFEIPIEKTLKMSDPNLDNTMKEALGLDFDGFPQMIKDKLHVRQAEFGKDKTYYPGFASYQLEIKSLNSNSFIQKVDKNNASKNYLMVTTFVLAPDSNCHLEFDESKKNFEFGVQGKYSFVMNESISALAYSSDNKAEDFDINMSVDIKGTENHHIWKQAVMYLIGSIAEVLISIVGLEYCYSEAPPRFRSVMQSIWLATVGLGNLPPIFLTKESIFPSLNKHSLKIYQAAIWMSLIAIPLMMITGYFYRPLSKAKNKKLEHLEINCDEKKEDDAKTAL